MLRRRYFSEAEAEGEVMYEGNVGDETDIIIDYGKDIKIGGKYVFEYEVKKDVYYEPMSGYLARFRMGSAHDFINCGFVTAVGRWGLLVNGSNNVALNGGGTIYDLGNKKALLQGSKIIITLRRTGEETCDFSVECSSIKTDIANVTLSKFNAWSVWADSTMFSKIKVTRY